MALRCVFFRDESADLESFSLMYSYELASCLDTDTIQNQTAIAFLNGAELCEAYYKEVWIVDRKSVAYNRAMIKSIRSIRCSASVSCRLNIKAIHAHVFITPLSLVLPKQYIRQCSKAVQIIV